MCRCHCQVRNKTPLFERVLSEPGVHKVVLREFLNPRHWRPPENRDFVLSYDQVGRCVGQGSTGG